MKPVTQTIMANLAEGIRGDCFRACIAGILELPVEEVPHFIQMERWWQETQAWLGKRNLSAVLVGLPDKGLVFNMPLEDVPCILMGKSPRGGGMRHSVIGRAKDGWNFEITCDPHPSRAGLEGQPDAVMLLVPMKPELCRG